MKTEVDFELLFDDGHQDVNAHRDPDLRFDGVDRGAQEALDAQMALDPFEEEFDLPATFVEGRDGDRRQGEVVGEKHQGPLLFDVVEADAAHFVGVVGGAALTGERDGLVATHATGHVDGVRVESAKVHALLGPDDEERPGALQAMESLEIEIAAIHDIERARLEEQLVEPVDFVPFSLGDRDEAGNGTTQIQQGVELDGGLGAAEARPRKQTQTQVDGAGVQRVGGGVEFHRETVLGIELARPSNQHGGEVGVDAPVAPLVGLGQGAATHSPANAHVIELLGTRTQTNLQVTQTLAKSQLPKRHARKLVPAGKLPQATLPVVAADNASERIMGDVFHELGENNLAGVHPRSLTSPQN